MGFDGKRIRRLRLYNASSSKPAARRTEVMRGWSFPLGPWMGVELRIHTFFILLLGICMAYTESAHLSMFRGIGLWLVLLGAVAVREVAHDRSCLPWLAIEKYPASSHWWPGGLRQCG